MKKSTLIFAVAMAAVAGSAVAAQDAEIGTVAAVREIEIKPKNDNNQPSLLGDLARMAGDQKTTVPGWALIVKTKTNSWGEKGEKLQSVEQPKGTDVFKVGDSVFLLKKGDGWGAPTIAIPAPPQPPEICDPATAELKKLRQENERLAARLESAERVAKPATRSSYTPAKTTPAPSTKTAPERPLVLR